MIFNKPTRRIFQYNFITSDNSNYIVGLMTPEKKARIKIDQMFEEAGWVVVDRDRYSPTLTAAAIREGLLEGNREADYFLFINGMAVGILEAKREEIDVTSDVVCEQASRFGR